MRSENLPQYYCTMGGLRKSRRLSPLSLRNIMIILTQHGSGSETNILDSHHGSLFEFLPKKIPCFINIDINFVISSSYVYGDNPNHEQMKRQKNTIRDGGSTVQYTVDKVYNCTLFTLFTLFMHYTFTLYVLFREG